MFVYNFVNYITYLKPKEKGFSATGKSLVILIIEQRYSQS